ncbi:MAG TPA: hypothetical protein VFR84_06245 [Candidatus Angelobacter sp.]|nr:hypothetical protein [Candidatus Angelobacter sp.]
MRQDIIDRGIEKAENEMRPVLESLSAQKPDQGAIADPLAGRAGSNSGQMSSVASDQPGATPYAKETGEDLPERAGVSRREKNAHERQVDSEAVRESEKEAELDTTSEPEPDEGKPAA